MQTLGWKYIFSETFWESFKIYDFYKLENTTLDKR